MALQVVSVGRGWDGGGPGGSGLGLTWIQITARAGLRLLHGNKDLSWCPSRSWPSSRPSSWGSSLLLRASA